MFANRAVDFCLPRLCAFTTSVTCTGFRADWPICGSFRNRTLIAVSAKLEEILIKEFRVPA